MKYLLRKDLIIFLSSPIGYVIISTWLLLLSLFLWLFNGSYNLPKNGYSDLSPFFSIASILLLFFAPAVTMRLFAEEKRSGTAELLCFRPVSIYSLILTKYLASLCLFLLALLPTCVYVCSIYIMSPSGIDWGEVIGGYLGLICLLLSFLAIGVFTSSLVSNQLVAFLLGALLSFACFWGFDLVAGLYSQGHLHNRIAGLGAHVHYRSMMRGVIDSRDLIYFFSITFSFLLLSYWVNTRQPDKASWLRTGGALVIVLLLNLVSSSLFFRVDLTEGQRYTLSPQSRDAVGRLENPLHVVLHLNGSLNPSFDRLRTASIDLLEEMAQYAPEGIILTTSNLSQLPDEPSRQAAYLRMEERGMSGISVNERDNEGRVTSKVIFPWMEFIYAGDTIPVSLLRRNINLSSLEMLNASIGELEYAFVDAVRLLQLSEPDAIAFIEGHGEFTEPYVYEATELLSKYYHVDRGMLDGNPESLFPYKVVIVASPQFAFSEADKYCLDQYLMNGGSLFFLLDGVQLSADEFRATGESPTLKNELNLDDMLFVYGLRINPVTVQDMSCTSIRVVSSQLGASDTHVTVPWYFAPLLEPSPSHVITRNISPLKSELVSTISWVGEESVQKTTLLTTSANAHTLSVPEKVSLRYVEIPAVASYFNESHLPVAGLLQGAFNSVFNARPLPAGVHLPEGFRPMNKSHQARILLVAGSSLIKNDWKRQEGATVPIPLGYDVVSDEQLGNPDFIVNAVNYLAGNEQWLNLRSRSYRIRLLDKQAVTADLPFWQAVNILLPLVLLFGGGITFITLRKRRYRKG